MNRIMIYSTHLYPFGGGESSTYQLAKFLVSKFDCEVVWYASRRMRDAFTEVTKYQLADKIRAVGIPESLNGCMNIAQYIKEEKVCGVITYGADTHLVAKACEMTDTQFICIWHFWTNAVDLVQGENYKIMDRVKQHKPSPRFLQILNSKTKTQNLCTPIVNSEFVQQVIKSVTGEVINAVLYPYLPLPNPVKYLASERKAIVCLNIHPLKGGLLFRHMALDYPNIPFIGVYTEPFSERKFFDNIPNLKVLDWVDNVDELYSQARLVIATSVIDETYCRVVAECANRGIPVITTRSGNIPNILGSIGYYVNINYPRGIPIYPEQSRTILELYNSEDALNDYSRKLLKRFEYLSSVIDDSYEYISEIIGRKWLSRKKIFNVMFYCPWYEQGLGYQAIQYYKHLHDYVASDGMKVKTHIFSFAPYEPSLRQHTDEKEWIHPSIYYSDNDREHVTTKELVNFVTQKCIDVCVIPEICFDRVFTVPRDLSKYCKVVAIPNVEICRKCEFPKYSLFNKILCNNQMSYDTLTQYQIQNVFKLGFELNWTEPQPRQPYEKLTFCWFGGTCPTGRKQLELLLTALEPMREDFEVIITMQVKSQKAKDLIKKYASHPRCKFFLDPLTSQQIQDILRRSDMCIIITQHEGLGMGFFEAIQQETPVLTYDAPPHNEIIPRDAGILIPATFIPPQDNAESPVPSITCTPFELRTGIFEAVLKGRSYFDSLRENMKKNLQQRKQNTFKEHFYRLLAS